MIDDSSKPQLVSDYLSAAAWCDSAILARSNRDTPQIAIDRTPVAVRGEPPGDVWWRGRQWAVTADGIEALDGTYLIKADRLTDNLHDYPWPKHMAGKRWCDVDEFTTAWLIGLLLHGHAAAIDPAATRALFKCLPIRDVIPRWLR